MVDIFCLILGLQVSTSHAVPNAHYGPGHFSSLDIHQMEEIPRMIEPARCNNINIVIFAQDTCHIRSFPRESSLITLL